LAEVLSNGDDNNTTVAHAFTLAEALEQLRQQTFDLVLLDLVLPDSNGLQTFADLRAVAPHVAVIVITGLDDEDLAVSAMRQGAADYLMKGRLDSRTFRRAISYALERSRFQAALRRNEEFFRLISENVSDLIAVLDEDGKRLYNSPSYKKLLGDPLQLVGSDSFEEIHPADRERIMEVFQHTLQRGVGVRTEYRMILRDGSVRFIESQGNVMRDGISGSPKLVVVSRDITDRKASTELLREALSDLKKSHEELKATQLKLVQSEKVEAVSTFAAGVAHEVKNPLQTIILGVDFLAGRVAADNPTLKMVLSDMANAVQRADSIIHALMEFSGDGRKQLRAENLNNLIQDAIVSTQTDLLNYPISLQTELADPLPLIELDARTMKHVFINLLLHSARQMPSEGGKIRIRTFPRKLNEPLVLNGKALHYFKPEDTVVFVEIRPRPNPPLEPADSSPPAKPPIKKENALGITVLKKIVELFGGVVDVSGTGDGEDAYTIVFKAAKANV